MFLLSARSRIFIISYLVTFGTVYAKTNSQSHADYERKVCQRMTKLHFPKSDLPTAKDSKELEGCSSSDLYFGINVPQDYVKARKCAFIPYLEGARGDTVQSIMGDYDILTMVYANGKKVKRNVDLASKIVCETGTGNYVGSNINIRFLQNLKRSSNPKDFNVCEAGKEATNHTDADYYSPSFACSDFDVDIKNSKAALRIKKFTAKYTPAQKKEFDLLLIKATDFFERHVSEEAEINQSPPGSSVGSSYVETEFRRNISESLNSLRNSIYVFEQGKFPGGSKQEHAKVLEDFTNLFNEIKALYADNQQCLEHVGGMTQEATMQSENEIQAAWVDYFNQFIKFAATRYPQVPQYKWEVWLLKPRVTELKEYLSDLTTRLSIAKEQAGEVWSDCRITDH